MGKKYYKTIWMDLNVSTNDAQHVLQLSDSEMVL
jgi:hypothetical protein